MKYLNAVVQGVSGKHSFFLRFQDGCEKDINPNELTVVTVDNIPVGEEPKVRTIAVIPDEKVDLYKGFYHGVHVMEDFTKEVGLIERSRRQTLNLIQMRRIWKI